MYSYDKKIEDRLYSDLHNQYNTEISFVPRDIVLKTKHSLMTQNFSINFEASLFNLFLSAVSDLNGNCFPCLINDTEQINAFAEKRYDIPIIGVHLPLIAECIGLSHSFMMYDDLFEMTRPIIHYDYRYYSPKINDNGNIMIETPKNKDKKKLADIIAYFSVKFIILHEIAHHDLNHLEKTKNGRLSAKTNENIVIDGVSLQELEIEADIWATVKVLHDFEKIKRELSWHYSKRTKNLDTIKILFLSMLTPLLTINDKVTPENLLLVNHPPSLVRYNRIKDVYINVFGINESINNKYWKLIKKEVLDEYKKYEWMNSGLNKLLEKNGISWQRVDIIREIENDNADYIKYYLTNLMNVIFAYIIVRFAEMNGKGYDDIVDHFENINTKIGMLSSEGINLYKAIDMEV